MRVRIVNIGSLVAVPPGPVPGTAMDQLAPAPGAAIHIEYGRIRWLGLASAAPAFAAEQTLDAAGGTVIPGLIDCHTHVPFAGDRAGEFVRRLRGESYLSILESGGGIRVTSAAVRAASEEALVAENLPRLRRMLAGGVTTVECKSGYGLSPEDELKQLRAIRALAAAQPVELIPTYLGAHALPPEFDGRADAFIDAMSEAELLRRIAADGLARFADAFCDRGAFDVPQCRRFLERCAAAGLRPKLHADELAQIGASRLAGELRAASADHLEHIDEAGIEALRRGGSVAVALPGTSFYLGIPHAPARRMMDAGLPLAIATDFNPGSCHIESLPLVMNIACCQLRMTPIEALTACTANAAAAIGEAHRLGAIAPGYDADLVVLDAPNVERWMYDVGRPAVRLVLKRGKVVHRGE